MTGTHLSHNNRLVSCLLILIGVSGSIAYSQTELSGNLNQPKAHVLTVSTDRVTVDDVTGFAANDTILLIQMKGVLIDTSNYGSSPQNVYGQPGMHEFLIVSSVNSGTDEVVFRNNILNSFDIRGNVQMVRVPYYNSVNITGKLFCDPWDSTLSTGGVLAMAVGKKLELSADIDVSGLGFKGGKDTIGSGICITLDPESFSQKYHPRSFTNAGFIGEGAANYDNSNIPLNPDFMKGSGTTWNGGGGGVGRFSGGGGGSNAGTGGQGGQEDNLCSAPRPGGLGGFELYTDFVDRIFFGGGGGASTTSPAGSSSNGGNGGGIIIIVADTLMANGGSIISNGTDGGTVNGEGGSGGGGAGGTIVLSVRNFSDGQLTLSAVGGNGGDNPNGYGEGGGGGGGSVCINNDLPLNVTELLSGGLAGNFIEPNSDDDGALGAKRLSFVPNLNGFLFNSIQSSVTGSQTDSICSGMIPPKMTGTQPVGGTGQYTYLWEKSYDEAFTTPIVLTSNTDSINYSPADPESLTVWFRRTVTDQSVPSAIVDVSKPVVFTVQQQIQNNVLITDPDTICMNSDPAIITQGAVDLIFPSQYLKYIWQDSTAGSTWSSPIAAATGKEYDPDPAGGLSQDTWYRRTVISGRCMDNTAVIRVTVLPKLASNDFSQLFDTICFGGNTDLSTISGPTGGLPSDYRYVWQESPSGLPGSWSVIAGENTASYDPDAVADLPAGDHFFRRIVLSGEQDACVDTSGPAARKVWPVITGNNIQADQIIGYDSIPLKLTQSANPAGGAGPGTYNYSWVKDTTDFPLAPGPNPADQVDYQPPVLRWTTSFRRIVNSSVCADTSNDVMITVDDPIINSISLSNTALDTIYFGQSSSLISGTVPSGGSANPSDGYSVSWYISTASVPGESDWTSVTGSETQYDPGNLSVSTWFRRDVSSPAINPRATGRSNLVRVVVLPELVNTGISADQSICSGTRPLRINGDNLLAGGDGKYTFTWQDSTSVHGWQDISGYLKSDSANYKPPVLTSLTAYRRIVYSGKNDCGVAISDPVVMTVNPMPGAPDAGPDQTIYSINKTIRMNAAPPLTGETGEWKVLEPEGATVVDPSKYDTEIRNLALGANYFLWTVTTDAGQCSLNDTVSVFLNQDFIPRAFSPNGDGVNDRFIIEGLDLLQNVSVELKILNGAGSVVFSTSNTGGATWEDWDGRDTRGKDLPEGTYYYLFKMISGDRVDLKTGFIILKRN